MSGSYYEGLELLEHCNAIDFVDLVDHSYLIEQPKDDRHGNEEVSASRKRSNSSSSVSSEYELPLFEEPVPEYKLISSQGYVEKVIKRSKDDKFDDYGSNSNSSISGSNTSNKSVGSHSSRYKKSKKNMELQHQAILNNPFLQHTFISSDNFSSNKEAVANFTNILISRLLLNGIKSISLTNLKSFNSSSFATIAKSGSAANNLAEIALAVYNERFQVEDVHKHELCQRELLRIREQEVQKAKAAHEAEARNKAKLQHEANMRKKEKERMIINASSYSTNGKAALNKTELKKIKSTINPSASGKNTSSEFTIEDFTIALKSLLKNKDLKLPDLSPQQVDIIARSPTFQNNKVIIDLIRTTIKAKKTVESATSEHSKEEPQQPTKQGNKTPQPNHQGIDVIQSTAAITTSSANNSNSESNNTEDDRTCISTKTDEVSALENSNIEHSSQDPTFKTEIVPNATTQLVSKADSESNSNQEEVIQNSYSDTTEIASFEKRPINGSMEVMQNEPMEDDSSITKNMFEKQRREIKESDKEIKQIDGSDVNDGDSFELLDKQPNNNLTDSVEERLGKDSNMNGLTSQHQTAFVWDENITASKKETEETDEITGEKAFYNSEAELESKELAEEVPTESKPKEDKFGNSNPVAAASITSTLQ